MSTALPLILYESIFTDGTVTASTTATGFSPLNLADWRPYTWWKPTAMNADVYIDAGAARTIDYWALFGHDLYSKGVTNVYLYGSSSAVYSPQTLVDSFVPSSDGPVVRTIASSGSWRYWRITVAGSTAPSLAIAAVGNKLQMPRFLPRGFDPILRNPVSTVNRSQAGNPLGRAIQFEEWRSELAFTRVDWSWLRATWQPAWRNHLRGSPFLFAWDVTDHADEVYLVQATGGYSAPHVGGSLAELRFEVSGAAT
ncbi:MAG: hypothetical protein GC151_13950 [Betaproteobacteria bacterium]|nr:hypothetical protein [Betaproteobacteria bacterium]